MQKIEVADLRDEMSKTKVSGPMDLPFAMLVALLAIIGLIMMFSASYAWANERYSNPTYFLYRQGGYMLAGLAAMYIISRVNYQYLRMLSIPLMGAALVFMLLVPFIGVEEKGAKRWLVIAGINFQPSEIAKIAVIVMFSTMIAAYGEKMKTFRHGILPFIPIVGVFLGLLLMQPHLSGSILILGISAVLLFVGGIRMKWVAIGGGVLAAGGLLMLQLMDKFEFLSHAKSRIDLWQDPWLDAKGAGYQAIQSLYAIGSGGLFGLGLGNSRQKSLYLPEPQNDFVFAIVCEELGLIGACIVLFLFAVLIIRGYWIALHARDRFGCLLVTGVTTLLALQVFLNVAVVTSLIPVTGISMPFFSSGGTALLITLAEMGIVLSVSRQMPAPSPD